MHKDNSTHNYPLFEAISEVFGMASLESEMDDFKLALKGRGLKIIQIPQNKIIQKIAVEDQEGLYDSVLTNHPSSV